MSKAKQLTEAQLKAWMTELDVSIDTNEDVEFKDGLRDGVVLCVLVNKVKAGSVDEIKTDRGSMSAEDNILKFLQACNSLGVEQIFKLADLTDEKRDFTPVMNTLQELYDIAEGMGMGLDTHQEPISEDDNNPTHSMSSVDIDVEEVGDEGTGSGHDTRESPETVVRAKFAFTGEGEDELVFDKGETINVTKIVDGGWWEGFCNGRVGWFPGNYVEEVPAEELYTQQTQLEKRNTIQQFYDLVINDVLETERAYTNDLQTLLSVYLIPLQTSSVLPASSDVVVLTGNLPDVSKWQQGFFRSIQESSRLPRDKQNLGLVFINAANELEQVYSLYSTNHPKAVAVLTENSDKLSSFMESRGANSPGILTLTTSLSKPFKRLEKYPQLLKELRRNLEDDHIDVENVEKAIELYTSIMSRTQEVRKKKEIEHEMLTNPVQGFNGQCLMELGQCSCVTAGNMALNAELIDERYFLVFPDRLIVLAVGASLSGYELKSNLNLGSFTIKRGAHIDSWPFPVEITIGKETVHVSMGSEKDQTLLLDSTLQQQGGKPSGIQRSNSVISTKVTHTSTFRVGNPRLMRKNTGPINRDHFWGFMSLRPAPPLKTQQLLCLRDRDAKSPRAGKKFIYPASKKRRSKSDDHGISGFTKSHLVEQDKPSDAEILKVIEAYCASGKTRALISDKHSMPIRHSSTGPLSPKKPLPVPMGTLPIEADYDVISEKVSWTTTPVSPDKFNATLSVEGGKRGKSSFTNRTPSPTFSKRSERKGFLRNRSGSFDSHTIIAMKKVPGKHRDTADFGRSLHHLESQVKNLTKQIEMLQKALADETDARLKMQTQLESMVLKYPL